MLDDAPDRLRLSILGDGADDMSARFDRFAEVYRPQRGVRVTRDSRAIHLSVNVDRIETAGPGLEAAAVAAGLRIVIDDLAAEIRSSGLDGWASGVWAAIGDAVDEDAVDRSRDASAPSDPFRHLRVTDLDGARVVVDARPPRVDPVVGAPMDVGPQKFDDVDWHEGSAAEAGQPREHAFTHIGIFLAWLIRHDLHDPMWFPIDHVRAVKARAMTGSDIADDIDWKLISDEMTSEGAEFSAAQYDRYITEYDELVGDDAGYRVPETDALYERVAPMIDALYAEWIAAGRPAPEPEDPSEDDAAIEMMVEASDIPWDALAADADGPIAIQWNADGSYEVQRIETPHEDAALEALIPKDAVDPPIDLTSVSATQWGSSLLTRALKGLGVRPRDVTVAAGIGGRGDRALVVTVYRIPGASRANLQDAFSSVILGPRGSTWGDRSVGAMVVSWAEGMLDGMVWHEAYWARDELVFHVEGHPTDMETLIKRVG